MNRLWEWVTFIRRFFMKKIFIILSFLAPFTAQSKDGFYTSGLLGVNSTTMNATTGTSAYSYGEGMSFSFDLDISFGFRFGILFNDHVSAGIHLQRYTSKTFIVKKEIRHLSAPDCLFQNSCEIVNSKYDYHFTFNNFLAEFTYYINKVDENGLWISGLLGVTQVKTSVPNYNGYLLLDENSVGASLGTSLGYHFMVAPNFSISPQMSFIVIVGTEVFYSQFSGLVNVTLWL